MLRQLGKDRGNLGRRFSFAEDDLRHSGAQGAMMVDLGKAQILKWQMPQASDCVIGRELAASYIAKQFVERFRVQRA